MPSPSFTLLYVADPQASAAFYAALLDRQPIETSPTFVMFGLDHGLMLGLWRRDGVEPSATGTGGDAELAFTVAGPEAVDAAHVAWRAAGRTILQPPTTMDFGRTFLAADPDGHRLRVFAPAEAG